MTTDRMREVGFIFRQIGRMRSRGSARAKSRSKQQTPLHTGAMHALNEDAFDVGGF